MNNRKKVRKNLVVGFGSQVLTVLLGVIVPRLVITSYGSEINGLLSSVTQVYSYVALLEAGVGTATVQALYKRIAENDRCGINSVLAATNRYYHRTGVLYLVAIALFSVIYPLVVKTTIPTITVVLVIVLNGLGSVINYFFQAKYFLLLQAEGKNYVRDALGMFTNVFKNVAKIVLISAGFDVVFVQGIAMAVSLIQMIYVEWYVRRNYSWIDLDAAPDYESIAQSKNVLVHQISGLVFNSTDSITLTVFTNLKTVSVYSMYGLFFGLVNTVQVTISGSVVFLLGQKYHSSRDEFLRYYDCYEVYYCALSFALYTIVCTFILPFLRLYTSGVTDISYIDELLPYMFTAIGLLSCIRNASNNVISFAGEFKQTQGRSMVEAVINLVVSLVAVQRFGVYGVLLGSIVALLYRSNDIIIYTGRRLLRRSLWITYRRVLVMVGTFCAIQVLNGLFRLNADSYLMIVLYAMPYSLAVVALYLLTASVFEKDVARFALSLVRGRIPLIGAILSRLRICPK